ncbi:unnamed protein product [Peronospora destructor]|uniref:Uncharacterized protein n=1 Tax=Peronospora destructor TaxID=86335 RepID=A0AAV0T8M8_9STRA|nr:unnamed protein product [Peronospora destructor]
MFQYLTSMLPSSGPKFGSEVSEIERFRACQRHLYRGQAVATSLTKIEKLDIDNGRTRKISANRQRVQCCSEDDDGIWPKSAGTETHLGYNAFDFSTSPEAFYNEPEEPVTTKEFAAPAETGTTHNQHGQAADYVYGLQQHKHVGSNVSRTSPFWGTGPTYAADFWANIMMGSFSALYNARFAINSLLEDRHLESSVGLVERK